MVAGPYAAQLLRTLTVCRRDRILSLRQCDLYGRVGIVRIGLGIVSLYTQNTLRYRGIGYPILKAHRSGWDRFSEKYFFEHFFEVVIFRHQKWLKRVRSVF